jgi:hypothetical protein
MLKMKKIMYLCLFYLCCFPLWPQNFSLTGSVTEKFVTSVCNKNTKLLSTPDEYEIENFLSGNFELTFHTAGNSFAYCNLDCTIEGFHSSEAEDIIRRINPCINEAYLSIGLSDVLFLNMGKKRIVWGVAYFENPSDFINPEKDPTDPKAEKRGVYCTELELILDILSINQVVVIYDDFNYMGLGTKLSSSAIIPATDLNLVYYYSLNQLHNIGFSADTTPFSTCSIPVLNELALHCEAGLHQTSEYYNLYTEPVSGLPAVNKKPIADDFYLHVAGGVRIIIPTLQTFITAEYIYRQDAYTSGQFKKIIETDQIFFIDYYASRQGQHTLAISVTQPQFSDNFWDFTDSLSLTSVCIINLEDTSSFIHLELQSGLIPNTDITLSGGIYFGDAYSEFGIIPYRWFIGGKITLWF